MRPAARGDAADASGRNVQDSLRAPPRVDEPAPVPIGQSVPRMPLDRTQSLPRFYDTLLDALSSVGEGVAMLDGERFVYANEAFAQMVGHSAAALTSDFSVRRLFAPENRDLIERKLRERLDERVPDDRYEAVLVRADGRRVHVEVGVKSIDEGGRGLRFAVLRDITDEKRSQHELEEARLEVARTEKMATLGSLVSGVAHEVRTPLVYMQNSLATLERRLDELEHAHGASEALATARACAASIADGIERIQRLVKDLNKYTRLPTSDFAPTPLDAAVEEGVRLWRATHPGASIVLETQLEPTPPLSLDRAKIQQVVLNLLDNAEDASPRGGRVLVRTHPTPTGAQLVVQDEGVGMTQEQKPHIFEPLYTTKPEGAGLGLDIVRRIVELHRGTIRCDTSPGSGTCFTVTLPGPGPATPVPVHAGPSPSGLQAAPGQAAEPS